MSPLQILQHGLALVASYGNKYKYICMLLLKATYIKYIETKNLP